MTETDPRFEPWAVILLVLTISIVMGAVFATLVLFGLGGSL
jgi:hypothetical protein